MKKFISLLLGTLLLTGMLAACGNDDAADSTGEDTAAVETDDATTDDTATEGDEDAAPAATGESYVIGTNNWGVGAYPLDIIQEEAGRMAAAAGVTIDMANNEFTADKVISDLQNHIASGADGIMFHGIAQTMFNTAMELCEGSEIPLAIFSNEPTEEDLAAMVTNPYFCGLVMASQYDAGVQIAEIALEDGMTSAIISAAAVGDASHDLRVAGFTDTFTANGGEVLYESHSADPSEGTQKANDFMTGYPEADMIYCTGGDFVTATLGALEGRPDDEFAIYGTDVSPDTAQEIVSGDTVKALNGLQYGEGPIAGTLLVNFLDGHQILDEDGNAPVFDHLEMVLVTADNAQNYIDLMNGTGEIISAEEYQSLLYRNNPDVDYQTYYDFISNYNQMVSEKLS